MTRKSRRGSSSSQRTKSRPAPYARHQAPGSQRMSFGHAWFRRRARRTAGVRVSGADLLAGQRHLRRMAYLTLFPIGGAMRANLMVYREMDDPWLPAFRKSPEVAMCELMPRLVRLMGKFRVSGLIRIRPADLSINENYLQPGIVLAGDAFSTSCPAAGTGTTKVFNDVQLLCNTSFRAGSPARAWVPTSSLRSMTIRKRWRAKRTVWQRLITCARCRSTTPCRGGRSDGRGLRYGCRTASRGRFASSFQGRALAARPTAIQSRAGSPERPLFLVVLIA